ncbi:MAG: hypothetical protein F6K49_06460 [Moorea sp. SIO3I6]|nr:hypothetical protein [Moorena sp. SIO3I6]
MSRRTTRILKLVFPDLLSLCAILSSICHELVTHLRRDGSPVDFIQRCDPWRI